MVSGTGMGDTEGGTGDDRSDPLALAGWVSCGDAGLLGVFVSPGAAGAGTREGGWTGGGDA